jgi:hypothetical protein
MMLFRPVGLAELELIARSGFRAFPPRLPSQPFFYPVLTEEYAHSIARDWNSRDEVSGYAGFVTRFEVDNEISARYPTQTAGSSKHLELWVPAAELAAFNRRILRPIAVIAAYAGPDFRGTIDPETFLPANLASVAPRGRVVVYRLRDDVEQIKRIQQATLTTEQFGIAPTHGLLGSDEWWAQVSNGLLPTHTLRGVITRVFMGSMGDWPEFEIRDDSGQRSQWTREVASADLDVCYQPHRFAEIDYVVQRHRPKSYDGGAETKVVLEIRVDDAV